jgi:hypothetical protein
MDIAGVRAIHAAVGLLLGAARGDGDRDAADVRDAAEGRKAEPEVVIPSTTERRVRQVG